MFKCAAGHTSKPKEPMHKVVVETRPKTYFAKRQDGSDDESTVLGTGFETVREIPLCSACAAVAVPASK